jgi:hypothetical protein
VQFISCSLKHFAEHVDIVSLCPSVIEPISSFIRNWYFYWSASYCLGNKDLQKGHGHLEHLYKFHFSEIFYLKVYISQIFLSFKSTTILKVLYIWSWYGVEFDYMCYLFVIVDLRGANDEMPCPWLSDGRIRLW